ncbi:DISARM system phospholipase D-like protein DrmC [Herbaspirillum huttiense]|uniref:DISARM system phospholipase D-like protein DrmC n=1 Tax=Herbaspirillum huttiense TaxID=863372 RepID=UPI002176E56D|nr:DISARM system phospholipase D-like protein DrmC [Herbaspirillum huttiense]UWE16603.1 DISARM system phospholipase D-like protein DrmC [Herbaspirillum huttiense]
MTKPSALRWPEAAARFACDVSWETVLRVSDCLARGKASEAQAALSADAARLLLGLLTAWQCEMPSAQLSELGQALLAAGAASRQERQRQQLELVWSGPSLNTTTLRSTGPALLELIESAQESVYLVTFAAYKVPAVADALAMAERRGVRVVFVLEIDERNGGKVDFNPLPHLRASGLRQAEVYSWPQELRMRDERGRFGSLHAKFAVADRERLLVSSANLTEFAFNLNIELGVMVTGGHGPAEAVRQLDELIRLGVLRQAGGD